MAKMTGPGLDVHVETDPATHRVGRLALEIRLPEDVPQTHREVGRGER